VRLAAPFLVAFVFTVLVVAAVSMTPYFAGDPTIARAVQAASPGTTWAVTLTQTAVAPAKFAVMALALAAAALLAGWKGAALVIGALVIEQTGGEASKLIAERPRPSPDLVAVVGRPSGFSFPSTFTTFYAVTFGAVMLLAWRRPSAPLRNALLTITALLIVLGWGARVVPGAHWPSDVVLTTLVCLAWLWATIRAGRL
jgi:undecaprenyl-diphosphatase